MMKQNVAVSHTPAIHHAVYTCPIDHGGNTVVIQGWSTSAQGDTSVIIIHDVGESASGLDLFAEGLALEGYRVYGFDLRGFSERDRSSLRGTRFSDLALDLLQVVAWIKHKSQGKKPLIIGQGLGALLSVYFAKNYQKYCLGFVLVSPIIDLGDKIKPLKRLLIRFLAEIVPNVEIPVQLCPTFNYFFSENGKIIKKQRKISLRLTNELLKVMAQFKKLFHRLKLPALVICPDEDQLYKYDAIKRIIAKHPAKQLMRLSFVETREHNLLSCGPEFVPVMVQKIGQWLDTLPSLIVESADAPGGQAQVATSSSADPTTAASKEPV
jgi:alpha-beta hydrolase superfamily lysophospholipase